LKGRGALGSHWSFLAGVNFAFLAIAGLIPLHKRFATLSEEQPQPNSLDKRGQGIANLSAIGSFACQLFRVR
jgi:hypothetical protein